MSVAFKEMTHIYRETLCCISSEINLNQKFNFVVAKQKVETIVSIYFLILTSKMAKNLFTQYTFVKVVSQIRIGHGFTLKI